MISKLNVIVTVLLISVNCQAVPDANQNEALPAKERTLGNINFLNVLLSPTQNFQRGKLENISSHVSDTFVSQIVSLVNLVNNEAGVGLITIDDTSLRISTSAIGALLKNYSQQYIKTQYKNQPLMQISLTIMSENKIKETVADLETFLGNASLPLGLVNQALEISQSTKSAKSISVSNIVTQILATLITPIQTQVNYVFGNITTVLNSLYDTGNSTNVLVAFIANARNSIIEFAINFTTTVQTNVNQLFTNLINGTSSTDNTTATSKLLEFSSKEFEVLDLSQEVVSRANIITTIFDKIVTFVVGIVQTYVDNTFVSITDLLEEYDITDLPSNPIAAAIAKVVNYVVEFLEARVTSLQDSVDTIFSNILSNLSNE